MYLYQLLFSCFVLHHSIRSVFFSYLYMLLVQFRLSSFRTCTTSFFFCLRCSFNSDVLLFVFVFARQYFFLLSSLLDSILLLFIVVQVARTLRSLFIDHRIIGSSKVLLYSPKRASINDHPSLIPTTFIHH